MKKLTGFIATALLGLGLFAVLAPSANAGTTVSLHENQVGSSVDDPEFVDEEEECPEGDGSVIHFVAVGLAEGSALGTLTVNGGAADVIESSSNPHGTTQHYFVDFDGDTVESAVLETGSEQPANAKIVISHICPGDTTSS